jgi:hypothetical protein
MPLCLATNQKRIVGVFMHKLLIMLSFALMSHNSSAKIESILCSRYAPNYYDTASGQAFSTSERTLIVDFDGNSGHAYWFGSLFGTVVEKSLKPLNGTSPSKEKVTSSKKSAIGADHSYQIELASLSTGEELGVVTIQINKNSGVGSGTWNFPRLGQSETFYFCTTKVKK